jgi:hypothetical protein
MSIEITDTSPATREQWQRACEACGYATFFHTPQWAEMFRDRYPRAISPTPRLVRFDDGMTAVVPLVRVRYAFGAFHELQSSPAGTYGGWVSADPLTIEHRRALVNLLCELPNLIWRENPYDTELRSLDIPGTQDDFTQVIELAPSPPAGTHAHRKAIHKAERCGVAVRRAASEKDWLDYIRVYNSSLRRWHDRGLPIGARYDEPFFRLVRERLSDRATLWVAEHQGAVVAGVLSFYWNRHAVAWHGSAAESGFDLRPNNLLYDTMIRDAAGRGFRWFDLNPCRGLSGVVRFKEHLGAVRQTSRVWKKRSGLWKVLCRIRGL